MSSFNKTSDQITAVDLLGSNAKHILLYGGSRSGKTFILIFALIMRALKEPNSRHVILRYRFNHLKASIWYDTFPKVLELCFPGVTTEDNKTDWFKTFENGSEIWFGGLDNKERTEKILGNEYSTIYLNEISQMDYEPVTTMLTRLAQKTGLKNKVYYDCNPPSPKHWAYTLFVKQSDPIDKSAKPKGMYVHMRLNPEGNRHNLADDYIETILENLPERQKARFLRGEWLEDIEGALWSMRLIEKNKITREEQPELERIVIAVDPAITNKEDSDETGLIVCGIAKGEAYVIDDFSGKYSPNEWAMRVAAKYSLYKADRVIAEVNQGGDMVETIVRGINKNISYKSVSARKGKALRAEPVVALYERGIVHHVGTHAQLEDQMTTWEPGKDKESPDRVDALVYAITELMLNEGDTGLWVC